MKNVANTHKVGPTYLTNILSLFLLLAFFGSSKHKKNQNKLLTQLCVVAWNFRPSCGTPETEANNYEVADKSLIFLHACL